MNSADGQSRSKRDKTVGSASAPAQLSPQPQAETLYDTIFHAVTEAIAIWRPLYDKRGAARDLVFEKANEAFKQLFGISDPDGRRARKLSPSLDEALPEVIEMYALVAGSGALMQRECYFSLLDRWFTVKVCCPTKDHALAAFEDITERKLVTERLRRLESSLDHLRDYPLWVDKEGRIVEVGKTTCRTLEYTREELLGMTVFDIDPEATPEFWAEHWRRLKKVGADVAERRHRAKSGRLIPVDVAANYMVFDGQAYDFGFYRDITERLRTAEALQLTQFSVDQAPDLIHWLDPDGRITYANEAACGLLGYSQEELSKMHIWDISLGSTPELFQERWQAIGEGGTTLFEEVYRAKDGREFQAEIAATNFRYQGKELGLAFVRDITQWKEAQRSLRESEERYRQLFELESDAIVLAEHESGTILEVNEAVCVVYGYTRAELLAMRDAELFLEVERPESADPGWLTEDSAYQWHQRKDGTVFPVEIHNRNFEWKGQPVRVTAVRDISERKQSADELQESRQMLKQVLDTLPLEVRWRDLDLRYLGMNLAAARASDLPDPSTVIGLRDDEIPVCVLNEHCRDDDREVIATGVPKLNYVETVLLSNGDTAVKRSSKVPILGRSGEITGVLGIHENITEQVAVRRALKEREEQLRQSQKMEAIGRLAGGIAHDFNNVLTTIIGYSDLILSSPDCPKGSVDEDLREIRAAAERAGGLTRRILAFSRRQVLQPAILSLNTIVSDTERLLTRTLGADIELRVSLSPDLGPAEIDEQQFVQVLLNLAVNARDAMPDGGILTLETANVDLDQRFCDTHPDTHPGPYVVLSVSDTGTGMDADTMAHAFEPFYTTKPPGLGTGLGLSTVYGVVAQSGGSTYVHSKPGHGATFTIYLPRVQTEAASLGSEAGSAGGTAKSKTIMVVDDDATFLGLTLRILERRGYQVLLAHNGEEAIAMLGDPTISVDALITDMALPGPEQGDKVAAFASASRPGLPVLFMSVQPRDRMIQEGRVNERAAYLEKPFTAEELTSLVRTNLGET